MTALGVKLSLKRVLHQLPMDVNSEFISEKRSDRLHIIRPPCCIFVAHAYTWVPLEIDC